MKNIPVYFQLSDSYGFIKSSLDVLGMHKQVPTLTAVNFGPKKDLKLDVQVGVRSEEESSAMHTDDCLTLNETLSKIEREAYDVGADPEAAEEILLGWKNYEKLNHPEITRTLYEELDSNPGGASIQHMIRVFLDSGFSLKQISDVLGIPEKMIRKNLN